jgi:hypothetical protein
LLWNLQPDVATHTFQAVSQEGFSFGGPFDLGNTIVGSSLCVDHWWYYTTGFNAYDISPARVTTMNPSDSDHYPVRASLAHQ